MLDNFTSKMIIIKEMHQDLNVFLTKPKRRPDYKVFLLEDNLKDLLLCHIETSNVPVAFFM